MTSIVKVDQIQNADGTVEYLNAGSIKNASLHSSVTGGSGITALGTVASAGAITTSNPINFTGPNHTFTVKALNQPITDSQTGTTPDVANSTSDQLAIYNGSTKLWGISEAGYVVNPTLPCFVAHVTGGAYTSTSGVFPANATNHNQGNHYSTSTYAFTAPIDGVYLFTFSALSNNTGSTSRPMFYVNGSSSYNGIQHGIGNVDGNGSNSNATSCLIKLTAGDYVQVKSQNGSLYYYAGAHSSFSGCLIG